MKAENFDVNAVNTVLNEASKEASAATSAFLQKNGDRDMCGFAWVDVYGVRLNSKLGKVMVDAGFKKSHTGSLQLWNPSRNNTQCITAKEVGAEAYVKVIREKLVPMGVKECYAGSRLD